MLNDQLGLLANIVQIFNYMENAQQTSNDKIMQELQHQNQDYLENIAMRLQEILELLEKEKKDEI